MKIDVGKVLGDVQSGHGERQLHGLGVGLERDRGVVEAARVIAEAAQWYFNVSVRDIEDFQFADPCIRIGFDG